MMPTVWDDAVFRDVRDLARRVALRRGCSLDDAEDIAQEAVEELLRQARAGNQIRQVRAYAAITAANKHRDALRSGRRRRLRELRVAHGDREFSRIPRRPGVRRAAIHSYDMPTDSIENAHLMRAILSQLTPPQRSAVLLTFVAHLTTTEAARILGVTSQAITANIRRARDHLRWLFDTDYYLQRQLADESVATVNLAGAVLNGQDLNKRYLANANLADTDLADASLTEADLRGANLRGANLSNARMMRATLDDANLQRANLEYATLNGAKLTRAKLAGASLRGSSLPETTLTKANLAGADFSRADLRRAKAMRASFTSACLRRAVLRDADLTDADLGGADLSGADLSHTTLAGTNLRKADLTDADLSFVDATGADFSDSYLIGTNLAGANLGGTNLDDISKRIFSSSRTQRPDTESRESLEDSALIDHPDIRLIVQLLVSTGKVSTDAMVWQERARCAGVGGELFFPDGGDTRRAKIFCAGCPVWLQCLTYGLDTDHGVWGGLNRPERARLRRLRQRLASSQDDPANAVDIRRLLACGMSAERLGEVVGLEAEEIIGRSQRSAKRRSTERRVIHI